MENSVSKTTVIRIAEDMEFLRKAFYSEMQVNGVTYEVRGVPSVFYTAEDEEELEKGLELQRAHNSYQYSVEISLDGENWIGFDFDTLYSDSLSTVRSFIETELTFGHFYRQLSAQYLRGRRLDPGVFFNAAGHWLATLTDAHLQSLSHDAFEQVSILLISDAVDSPARHPAAPEEFKDVYNGVIRRLKEESARRRPDLK